MNTNIINRILQNTRHPKGFWGRMIIHSPESLEESLQKAGFVNIRKNVKDNEAHIVAYKQQN